MRLGWLAALLLVLALLAACSEGEPAASQPSASVTPVAPARPVEPALPAGNADRGRALVKTFECHRCHDGTGFEPMAFEKHCVSCHQDILDGKFAPGAAPVEKWKAHVADYRDVPSLAGSGRLRREWIARFLLKPGDLRPHLVSTMPRLPLSAQQASDIASYLTRDARRTQPADEVLRGADVEAGRRLLEDEGCGSCHAMSGAPALPLQPSAAGYQAAIALAPDLAFARDRYSASELVRWLLNPPAVKPGTAMPKFDLTREQARDVAAYLLRGELREVAPKPIPKRLPPLKRKVSFAEVKEKVFGQTCQHCHTDPDAALGDGGPGNTGGFGFEPRGFDVSSYSAVASGVMVDGERQSVFLPMAGGEPRLVASLLARQAEEAGQIDPNVRGMPLGLPALSPEQIQLVESWIAQGRPR